MITILPAAETNCVSDMKTKAEFEAAMKDLKREMISNMEQLRELKKMFEEQVKRKRRSKLVSGNINKCSASPSRKKI